MKASDTETLGMFDKLEGKQVWYISAPTTMPVSEIESLDVANALKGAAVLNHKGISYKMSHASVEGATLLLPQGRNGEYASAGTAITRSFRIQESSKITAGENTSEGGNDHDGEARHTMNFFATETGQMKTPRRQPENLKARYVPYGVPVGKQHRATGGSASVDEDVSMVDVSADAAIEPETASQRIPKTLRKTKHNKSSADDMDVDGTPVKQKGSSQPSSSLDAAASQEGSQRKKKEKSKKTVG